MPTAGSEMTCHTWVLMDASVLQLAYRVQTAILAVAWHAMPHVHLNHPSNPPAYGMPYRPTWAEKSGAKGWAQGGR
jgi:hypothetical protein